MELTGQAEVEQHLLSSWMYRDLKKKKLIYFLLAFRKIAASSIDLYSLCTYRLFSYQS